MSSRSWETWALPTSKPPGHLSGPAAASEASLTDARGPHQVLRRPRGLRSLCLPWVHTVGLAFSLSPCNLTDNSQGPSSGSGRHGETVLMHLMPQRHLKGSTS